MAYTRLVMQPLLPSLEEMPSIGSAAANWSQDARDSIPRSFSQNREARLVRYMFGQCDYEDYVSYLQYAHRRRQEEDALEAAEEQAKETRKSSRNGTWRTFRTFSHSHESVSSTKPTKSNSNLSLGSKWKRLLKRLLHRR